MDEEIILLFDAVQRGDISTTNAIVDDDPARLQSRDDYGDTPLIFAARCGHHELISYFVKRGAELNSRNLDGDNALIVASTRRNNVEAIETLLVAGTPIDFVNLLGRTALIAASSAGEEKNVAALLQAHPDLNHTTNDGETALTFAVVNGNMNVMRLLLTA
jgi:ankyrin repeat protein